MVQTREDSPHQSERIVGDRQSIQIYSFSNQSPSTIMYGQHVSDSRTRRREPYNVKSNGHYQPKRSLTSISSGARIMSICLPPRPDIIFLNSSPGTTIPKLYGRMHSADRGATYKDGYT
ncbi:hypothetical protein G6F20_014010 [Rhizopus arrhizus]|nr:hypothetical protein G6F20_014010 [Rhizopus arrhizus]